MKTCTCGAFKVYGAKPKERAHSDWCDVSADNFDKVVLLGAVPEPIPVHYGIRGVGSTFQASYGKQALYCKMYCNTLTTATKILQITGQKPVPCCDSCANLASVWGLSTAMWDINDPLAPAIP